MKKNKIKLFQDNYLNINHNLAYSKVEKINNYLPFICCPNITEISLIDLISLFAYGRGGMTVGDIKRT